jgi:UDP-N-acetylmuramyl pentapeptide phosphotransferase/UDP-N-acetylglucosamine-1-phosphate transferase
MRSLLVFLLTLPAAGYATGFVLKWLRKKQILDHPNDRSSHLSPTPRGAGLALIPVILLGWLVLASLGHALSGTLSVSCIAAALMVMSWHDDRKGLPTVVRLLAHLLAAAAGLSAMPDTLLVFQGLLPYWPDRAVALLAWVWFINLYNFMDGIDGITGVESLCLGIGIGLTNGIGEAPAAASIVAASTAFLWWNWQPAKIFLGDSGSVPLGFLLGWLLLNLAAHGLWVPALILPAYYLADATLTLAARLRRGEKVWQAHRSHFYQRAVQAGASHAAVSKLVLGGNFLLIVMALLALDHPWIGAVGAAGVVTMVLGIMAGRASRPLVR